MRAGLLLGLVLAALAGAKDTALHIEQAKKAAFVGYSDDAKAERAWEIRADHLSPDPGKPGAWKMDQLALTTFRDGKPSATFRTARGLAQPDLRTAGGEDPVAVEAQNFQLEGKGWNWAGTAKGDTFAILENVHATLLPGKPGEAGIQVSASRVDVTADDQGGNTLRFTGDILLIRGAERLSCERVDCVMAPGFGSCQRLVARGRVLHVDGARALSADELVHDLKAGKIDLVGAVRVVDPEFELQANAVHRDVALGVTECVSDTLVRAHILPTAGRSEATLNGKHVVVAPGAGKSGLTFAVDGGAEYVSGPVRLRARDLLVRAGERGDGPVTASGDVEGTDGKVTFTSEQARLDRVTRQLDLAGRPHLRDARGYEVTGDTVTALLAQGNLTVTSAPGIRAALLMRSAGGQAEAEADRVAVSRGKSESVADLRGAVRFRMAGATTTCDRLVAYAKPAEGVDEVELTQASMVGSVRYEAPGFAAIADRAELVPAVGVEAADFTGKPMLLRLRSLESAPAGAPRPRIEFASGEGIAAFTADRHDVLFNDAAARFVLNGQVFSAVGEARASCDELTGAAARDAKRGWSLGIASGTGDIQAEVGGNRATGELLQLEPSENRVTLSGNARVQDRQGRVGIPADRLVFDTRTRNWRMDSAPAGSGKPPVRPRILLPDSGFTLPLPQ